jgi:hypothetical protein
MTKTNDEAPNPEKSSQPLPRRLEALNQTQPALILEITAPIHGPGRGRKKFASVEAAARNAATAVLPTDPNERSRDSVHHR